MYRSNMNGFALCKCKCKCKCVYVLCVSVDMYKCELWSWIELGFFDLDMYFKWIFDLCVGLCTNEGFWLSV